jgi:hypothetical protein
VNLSYWLRKAPQPAAILADEKRIEVLGNARGWKELAATIASLEPSKLTALDKQGNVIRSIVLDESEDAGTRAPPSPEMSDLQLFAKLLADGYEKGMRANQPIIDSAMAFVERQGVRLLKAEAEIERLRAHIHKLNLQIAELSGGAPASDDSLLGTIMAGAMAAGGNPLLAVAANGGAKQGGKK